VNFSPTITWSIKSIFNSLAARIKSRVTLMSASLGVLSRLGWLCYVERLFMCGSRSAVPPLTQAPWHEERYA